VEILTSHPPTNPFKIWITLPGGEKIAHNAEDFELEKECLWQGCREIYRTPHREQDYCSNECAKAAANYRYRKAME
jgi:hypothetical protein